MTTMLQFRDKVVEAMGHIPGVRYSAAIKGALTEDGLERLSVRSPGILTAFIGFRGLVPLDTARYRANLVMSVFIVTEGQKRLDLGHSLMERAALLIAGNTWGLPHTKFPTEIKGEPIYDDRFKDRDERTSHLQESGVLIQAVSWLQETTVERTAPGQPGASPEDVAQALSLGQSVSDAVWPSEISAQFAPDSDYTPVKDTPGDDRTEEH